MLTDYVLDGETSGGRGATGLVIPVTVDDLAANGLLEEGPPSAEACWERSVETLVARKDEMAGLAVATDEGLEAYLLYRASEGGGEVVALHSLADDGGDRLAQLVTRVRGQGVVSVRFPKVHPAEIPRGGGWSGSGSGLLARICSTPHGHTPAEPRVLASGSPGPPPQRYTHVAPAASNGCP